MQHLLPIVFAITLCSLLVLAVCLIASLVRPEARVWPPPGAASWQFWLVWTLTTVAAVGTVVVGILDWNRLALDHWLRLPIGGALVVGGLLFARWGMTTLGRRATLGIEGVLVAKGPYRYTRNPQYVGDIAALLGWGILCNSLLTWIVSLLGMAWFALAPFTEEPWLRARYGSAYGDFRRRVPRFLGRPASREGG